jgi:hypothetical protein
MGSREINVEDIGWETPLFEQSKAWVTDNGIDPFDIPLESLIVVNDDTITYERFVLDENGKPLLAPDGDHVQRESVTVPKKSDPEAYGL